jgi:hypothetical protein
VAIDGTAIAGLDSISVTDTKAKSTATSGNNVSGDETVTLNITTGYTGAPEYIGGHVFIEIT